MTSVGIPKLEEFPTLWWNPKSAPFSQWNADNTCVTLGESRICMAHSTLMNFAKELGILRTTCHVWRPRTISVLPDSIGFGPKPTRFEGHFSLLREEVESASLNSKTRIPPIQSVFYPVILIRTQVRSAPFDSIQFHLGFSGPIRCF